MRLLRIAGGATAALVALALFAAWLAPRVLDWNQYRGAIASVASAGLGRPVTIAGPVSLTLLPHPVLVASGVTLPDAGDGSSADVDELRLQVGLGSLLSGRLDAEDLTLHGARMLLPWPFQPGALQQHPPQWLNGLHARIENGTLLVGGLTITDIAGALAADPATGNVSIDGSAASFGHRWRVTARLGRAGGDGSAPLEASLDSQDPAQDTGGTFSGQLAADGVLTGRMTGRGRDLSQVIAVPAIPWSASGRFRGADGLALADDLDVDIGGVPARGAVALRLRPVARVDAALAASRLDLDRWLPALLQGGGSTIPASVDLSAEAATLGGGTLRHMRAAFDITNNRVALREAGAIMPGDATATLSGHMEAGRFSGTGHLDAPHLRETLAWLAPLAPALAAALPLDVLQTGVLRAAVTAGGGKVSMDTLAGTVDGNPVTGMLSFTLGTHPAVAANLSVFGLNLDRWMPKLPNSLPAFTEGIAGWPGAWGGFDAGLTISATQPWWHGVVLDRLDLDAAVQVGVLTVRRAVLAAPDFNGSVAGSVAPGGLLTDGHLDLTMAHPAVLAPWLPSAWLAGLLKAPGALQGIASGAPGALNLSIHANLGDLQAEVVGTADMPRQSWTGRLDLQHPGASRLLATLGLPQVRSWLGEGSFSLAASMAVAPARIGLRRFTLSAGEMRTSGDLLFDQINTAPKVTGHLDAEVLTLPLPAMTSAEPLPVTILQGWQAAVGVKAREVTAGLWPVLHGAAASVTLADGALHVAGLSAGLAGGRLTGGMDLDVSATPRLALQGSLTGAVIDSPLVGGTMDLASGRVDAAAHLTASGFSPGTLLATLDGAGQVAVTDGVLTGVDLGSLTTALDAPGATAIQAGIEQALQGGGSLFRKMAADFIVHGGVVTVPHGTLAAEAATADVSGMIDLPAGSMDLQFYIKPAHPDAPVIGLRLIGPVAQPRRAPGLAALAGWLAGR